MDWVTYWVIELDQVGPGVDSPWIRGEEVLGFRGGTTGKRAVELTRFQTNWLRDRLEQIERLDAAVEFFSDVQRITWSLQATVGMSRRERPPANPRPCPVCGELEVRGSFFGESLTAAEVRGDRWMTTRADEFTGFVSGAYREGAGAVLTLWA